MSTVSALDQVIGLEEAATILGLSAVRTRGLAAEGRLRGKKVGKTWVTTVAEAQRVAAIERPTGRPSTRIR